MNNAGFGIPAKPLDECTSEEVNKVIGICLIAVTNCIKRQSAPYGADCIYRETI